MMGDMTNEQKRIVKELAGILGKTEQEIMNTTLNGVIELLVDHIKDRLREEKAGDGNA